jgi:hypothetical protein
MNKKTIKTTICVCATFLQSISMYAQAPAKKITWDGMAIIGYVDKGAFVNFGGPTVKLINKPWSLGFGILPTMRIKEDKVTTGAKKNAIVTPTAGFGFTVVHKHFVAQVPFYYNAKSTTANGKWNIGLGIGFKF